MFEDYDYVFTPAGITKAEAYIKELEAKRKEILDAGKDTADMSLPNLEDILSDVDCFGFDEDGEYINSWGVTDNYDADCPLQLCLGVDILENRGCNYAQVDA